eukprot:gene681-756_t
MYTAKLLRALEKALLESKRQVYRPPEVKLRRRLDHAGLFTLKLTEMYHPRIAGVTIPPSSGDVGGLLVVEVTELLISDCAGDGWKQVSEIARDLLQFTGIQKDSVSGTLSLGSFSWPDIAVSQRDVLNHIAHPQVFLVVMDALLNPEKSKSQDSGHTDDAPAVILAVLTSWLHWYNCMMAGRDIVTVQIQERESELNEAVTALLRARNLCLELSNLDHGLSPGVDAPASLLTLLKLPVVSALVLRWVYLRVSDAEFSGRGHYATQLPTLLQFVVAVIDDHPPLHPDCFTVLEMTFLRSAESEERGEAARLLSARRDTLETLVHLMGSGHGHEYLPTSNSCQSAFFSSGYSLGPLDFLAAHIATVDATLVRHLMVAFLRTVSPPYSPQFVRRAAALATAKSVRDAISRHFGREGHRLLNQFCASILSEPHYAVELVPAVILELQALAQFSSGQMK